MINLEDYGLAPNICDNGEAGEPARITAVHRDRYELISARGEGFGRLKAGVYYGAGDEEFPTAGDFVRISYNPGGDSQILKTLTRKSFFSRREPGPIPRDQAVAANFEYVFILLSLNQDFNPKRLERYLTLAWQSGAVPVVVLTKADLTDNADDYVRAAEKTAAGVCVCPVSAVTGYGLSALADYVKPRKTIVLLGSSGVGKSSLLNALAGSEVMDTAEIREDDAKGRHTTTHRQLVMIPCGAMVIDTPGMRELGMWEAEAGLAEAFADVEQYLGKCRFGDCRHQSEPGCAIREAVERGELSSQRWSSFAKLEREAKYAENKAEAIRIKSARHKKNAREQKHIKNISKR